MIRILHMIGGLDVGGSQSLMMSIYRKIDRDKMQFDFVIDRPEHSFYVSEIEELGGRVYEMPPFARGNILKIRTAWNDFFTGHPEYKVLHSHIRSYASVYIPIAKKHGLVTIIHSHNTSNGSGVAALAKAVLQYPLRFQADYYFSCSVGAGKWLFGRKSIRKDNFHVLPNGIESEKYIYSTDKRKRIREALNISEETFVLGFLARVVEQKNPLFVVDVFRAYLEKAGNEDSRLLFVGDGKLLDTVKQYAKKNNLLDYIIFTGQRTDTADLMMAMDVYLFPSLWEGLGITLIEAQATGMMCICSENIQSEAIISKLVTKIPLNMGAKAWAEHINPDECGERETRDMRNAVNAAGYDIEKTARWLYDFYMGIA